VTGATGFIGRHLVPSLIQKGYQIAILVSEKYGSGQALPPPLNRLRPTFEVVYADLRNYRLTRRAIEQSQPSSVIHLAAAGVTDPFLPLEAALRNNTFGTMNLLRACFEPSSSRVNRLIAGRTPGELSAMNPYAASKAATWICCQMYARTDGWPIAGAMIYQAYGPGQSEHSLIPAALAAARAGQDFPMTSGRQLRDWIYIDDVVSAILASLSVELPPGDTVEIGTGRETSVADVVREIYRQTGKGGKLLIGALPDRPGEEQAQVADAQRTEHILGWKATTNLELGLSRLLRLQSTSFV
jgi:nucleoside-diphosphate-sugar epimerase